MRLAAILGIGTGAILTAAYAGSHPKPAPHKDVRQEVAWIAQHANTNSPITLTAEGDVLVFHMDAPFSGDRTEDQIMEMVKPAACGRDGIRGLLADGAKVRFEVTNADYEPQTPVTISSCD